MDKAPMIQVGGSIESALKGEYSLDPRRILQEAWVLTKATRSVLMLSLIITLSIGTILTALLLQNFGGFELLAQEQEQGVVFAINLVVVLVISPLLAALDMMAVFSSVGVKLKVKMLFSFYKKISPIALCTLLSSFLVNLGLILFVIPAIYFLIALMPAIPLMINKNISPLNALIISIKATRFQLVPLFLIFSFLFSLFLIIAIPLILLAKTSIGIVGLGVFFFGLTYIIPLFYNAKGIIYREIFGLQLQQADNNVSSIFSA